MTVKTSDTFLRLVRVEQRGHQKTPGYRAIARVELIRDGEVVAEIPGVTDAYTREPLDGVASLTLTTIYFDQVIEPPKQYSVVEESA